MKDEAERIALAARIETGAIKALSIKQPYPHHIFHDGKDVENRDWPTKGRGWFLSFLPRRWLKYALTQQWLRTLQRREVLALIYWGATGNPDHHPFQWADKIEGEEQ